jgi:predicted nucleic acid-binding protein
MTEVVPLYVVDASVALKWIVDLDDEPHTDKARDALLDYQEGRINIIAPSVLPYEIGHALTRAIRRARIDASEAIEAYRTLLEWNIHLVHDDFDLLGSLRHARLYGLSFYDASYWTLANRLNAPWLYADDRVRNTHGPSGAHAASVISTVWIGDYHPVVVPES